METIKYKIARILTTIEFPIIFMLLSLQATDEFWSNVWFCVAMYKFILNIALDYFSNYYRQQQLNILKGILMKTKLSKEQEKQIRKIVKRYMRMRRKRFFRKLFLRSII